MMESDTDRLIADHQRSNKIMLMDAVKRTSQLRVRRQTSDDDDKSAYKYKYEDEELEFYLGFELDGFRDYENMTQSLPEYSQIDIYIDPVVATFPNGGLTVHKPFWPFNDEYIDIRVSNVFHWICFNSILTDSIKQLSSAFDAKMLKVFTNIRPVTQNGISPFRLILPRLT